MGHSKKQFGFWQMLGWFLLAANFLEIWFSWSQKQTINWFSVISLLAAFGIIASSEHWFGISNSTEELFQQQVASQAVGASALHRSAGTRPVKLKQENLPLLLLVIAVLGLAYWFFSSLLSAIPQPSLQLVVLFFFPLLLLLYALYAQQLRLMLISILACYLVLLTSQATSLVLLCLLLLSASLWSWAWQRRQWTTLGLIMLSTYAVLAHLALEAQFGTSWSEWLAHIHTVLPSLVVWMAFIGCVALFSLPFIFTKRQIEERSQVQRLLMLNAVFYCLLPFLFQNPQELTSWLLSGIILLFLFASFAYMAFRYHGRYSYAKYYFLIVVGLFTLLTLVQSSHPALTVLWLLLSLLVSALGFAVNSYTARMAGLVLLLLAVVHYGLYLFTPTWSEPTTPGNQIWVGGVLITYLWMLMKWYAEATGRLPEQKALKVFRQVFFLTIVAIIIGLLPLNFSLFWQDLGWIWLGIIAVLWGWSERLVFTEACGIALVLVTLAKLFFSDGKVLSSEYQYNLPFILGFSLLLCGYLAWRAAYRTQSLKAANYE